MENFEKRSILDDFLAPGETKYDPYVEGGDVTKCEICGQVVPAGEIHECANCDCLGCLKCMVSDPESTDWFCDSSEDGIIGHSECYREFIDEIFKQEEEE